MLEIAKKIYNGFTDERFFRIVMLTAVIIFGSLIQHRLETITTWNKIGAQNSTHIRAHLYLLRKEVDRLQPNSSAGDRIKPQE